MADLIEHCSEGVATLTLNRPDRLNAFSDEMLRALCEALPRLGADTGVGAIILTGAGHGFCAGGDVKAMASRAERSFEERLEDMRWKHQVPLLVRAIPKVVIAMVNGPAVGAGLGLALASDLRIAGRSARFATAFGRVGLSGDFGGSWLLTRLVGTAKARELYYFSESLGSEQAAALGLVNRVVEDGQLLAETTAMARSLATGPRLAYGYMKRNLNAAETQPLAAVLELEALHQVRTGMTEDHREARLAFIEKRKPAFTGS